MSADQSAKRSRRPGRVLIVGLVVLFVATYAVTVGLYSRSGCGCPRQVTQGQPTADGTTVTIDLQELQSVKGGLSGNVTVSPGRELLDPQTGGLSEDLTVAVHSAVTPTKRSWPKGTVPGVSPVPLTITGDPSDWPFDHYHSGPITVDLFRGASPVPQRASVTFVDRIPGWRVDIPVSERSDIAAPIAAPYRVELRRSPSTAAFAAVIVAMMIAIAAIALSVAVLTALDRRKFQPPMTTWYAAMLFAIMPLRNALPDAPPIGSWIDVTVTLWVIVALVNAMLLYIFCWWRHLRPEPATVA